MSNPLPDLLALTSIADGSQRLAAPIRNNYAALQAALNEILAALNAGAAGQMLQSGGADALQWGPKITTSTFAAGPPAAPVDQDIWLATAVDANGTRWMFQYNAGSASTSKWEFIGGSPVRAEGGGGAIVSTAYVDLPGTPVSVTLARAGDYIVRFGGHIYNSGATTGVFIGIVRGATAAADATAASTENPAINNAVSVAAEISALGLAAAAVVKLQGRVVSGTGNFGQCYAFITPVRIA